MRTTISTRDAASFQLISDTTFEYSSPPAAVWGAQDEQRAHCAPKRVPPKAKQAVQASWRAETKAAAARAFAVLLATDEPTYPKATACVQKDREEWLPFDKFPAPPWQRLRTTHPIEST